MGLSISDLPPILTLGNDDVFEIEQDGVSRKASKALIESVLGVATITEIPLEGDVLYYDGSIFRNGPVPRWREVPAVAYTATAPASTSTITFDGGDPTPEGLNRKALEYFSVGDPVRIEIGAGIFFYGMCTAATNTLLTIAGAILPLDPILSISVGNPDMIRHVRMGVAAATYNSSTTLPLTKGCRHRWRGRTGYLVSYSCCHMNTSGTVNVQLQMNGGSNVSTTGVVPAAGASSTVYGNYVDSANGTLIAANVAISDLQTITATTPVITGLADFLIIDMYFVVP